MAHKKKMHTKEMAKAKEEKPSISHKMGGSKGPMGIRNKMGTKPKGC